ncbi:MAG: hypothetical protein H7A43_06615 [Verrucomicrobia bacterium]|nr:hypothetical protein [Verrucomicrobiota bacterium]
MTSVQFDGGEQVAVVDSGSRDVFIETSLAVQVVGGCLDTRADCNGDISAGFSLSA